MSDLGNKEIMAKNIKHYMDLNNIRPKDICETLHFPMATFSDWIHAKSYPRIDKIELMANYFGINKSDLVEAPTNLSPKDEKDIAKKLSETLEQLNAQEGLMFDGDDMDEHTKEMLKISLENAIRTAKAAAKEKFNPNKNKQA